MSDARLKALFKRAADIAEQVPEHFQEAAFHRALDTLVGTQSTREAHGYAEYLDEVAAEAQRDGLPKAAAKMILDKSFDVLNLATGVLGVEALSADQVAKILNESYGLVVSNDMVSRTLDNADGLFSIARRGGNTLYQIIQPGRVIPGHKKRAAAAKKKAAPKAKPKPAAKIKAKPATAKKSATKKRAQKKK